RGLAKAQDQLVMIMRRMARARDRLEPFLFGDVFCDRLTDVLVRDRSRVEDAKARQRLLHELAVQGHVHAERPQGQLTVAKSLEKWMPLGMPALADCHNLINDGRRHGSLLFGSSVSKSGIGN